MATLVLFDIDGTLLLSGGAGRRALERALVEVAGLGGVLDGVSLAGKVDRQIAREALEQGAADDEEALDLLVEAVLRRYAELLAEEVERATEYRVLPNVRSTLEALSRRDEVYLALGTGNVRAGARIKLGRAGLNDYFEDGGFGEDGETRVEVLRAAVRRASGLVGVSFEPEQVVVVGDTPLDVAAARDLGARIVAVATGTASMGELAACRPDSLWHELPDHQIWLEEALQ